MEEISKYSGLDALPLPTPCEMKKKVRLSQGATAVGLEMPSVKLVKESVTFAGQRLTIERALVAGSEEERRYLQRQKRRSNATLGGSLKALDQLLGTQKEKEINSMEKSDIDWSKHKEEAILKSELMKNYIYNAINDIHVSLLYLCTINYDVFYY